MGKWIETDKDKLLFCRNIADGTWELYKITEWDIPAEECRFRISHAIIFRNEIDYDDVADAAGFDTAEAFQKEYPDRWEQVAAETWFELNADEYFITYCCFSYKEAEELLKTLCKNG